MRANWFAAVMGWESSPQFTKNMAKAIRSIADRKGNSFFTSLSWEVKRTRCSNEVGNLPACPGGAGRGLRAARVAATPQLFTSRGSTITPTAMGTAVI